MLRLLSHSRLVRYSLTILSLSAATSPLWAQEDDPELRDRFLKGVARTATKLEQLSFRAKFDYVDSATGKDASDKTITRKTYEVAIRGICILETGVSEKSGNVFFRVRNDDYAFALERTPGGKRASLQFVERIGSNPKMDTMIAGMEKVPRAFALRAFCLWSHPLFRLVESGSFSIKRVYAVTSGDKELVRVEFDIIVDDPAERNRFRLTDGFLVCDPAREWALTEYGGTDYRFASKSTRVMNAVLESGESIGGIPIATKITLTDNSLNIDLKGKTVITTEIISRDVPEAEFFLSHYGLPEPNFDQHWFGAWAWYLIAGIVCLVVSAIIFKRRRATG